MKQKLGYIIYIVSVLLGLFVLALGLFIGNGRTEAELSKPEGELDFAKQMEEYVSQNFALRKNVISAYTTLQQKAFLSSPVKDVVIGESGYLFYRDTVEDYSGLNLLNEREVYNVQKTLGLMAEHVEAAGGQFVLLIAPNKNSLYDYMPANYIKSKEPSNASRILAGLDNVMAVNLFTLFEQNENELYFKTDTHWNDEGAYYVYEAVQQALGYEPVNFPEDGYSAEKTLVGDLANMLHPGTAPTEEKLVFQRKWNYEFLTKTRSFEQGYIETVCEAAKNSLLMFRDSFANNLVEYFGESYHYAVFDKSLPYDLTQMENYHANVVLAEIAERNLREYVEMAPIMPAPKRTALFGEQVENLCEAFAIKAEDYVKITGEINNDYTGAQTDIYVRVNETLYEMTPVTANDNLYGFVGYVKDIKEADRIVIVVATKDNIWEQVWR